MNIKWQTEIKTISNGTMFDSHCEAFFIFRERIYHAFTCNQFIYVLDFDAVTGSCNARYFFEDKEIKRVAAKDMKYHLKGASLLLYSGYWHKISGNKIRKARNPDIIIKQNESYENKKYFFGDNLVSFPSPSTIACNDMETGNCKWKYAIKGYPYTDIEKVNDYIFFGTAGKGGALYCINLDSGEVKRDISTKGTAKYCWYNNTVLTYTEDGHLQRLDPYSDNTVEVLKMDNMIGKSVPMMILNDCLYTITFSRKNKDLWPKQTYLTCISLAGR